MADEERINELNRLARVHHRLNTSLDAPLPQGAKRLGIHPAHVASAKRVIIDRMAEIANDKKDTD